MSDWQWFEDFETKALAKGDRERVRLRQLHREAYSFRETDPDRALSLLSEGSQAARTLGEPWWVLLFDHWQVHITLYDKSDYRNVLEPAVRNVLEARKSLYRDFPQKLWILGDLIEIYVSLDPRGFAKEIQQALADVEAELSSEFDNGRYLFLFHQLDAAVNQDRADDALQISLRICATAQSDPVRSTGDHYLIPNYRSLCHHYSLRKDWGQVAAWAEAGEALARQYAQKQPVGVFQMWQAVIAQHQGKQAAAARLFQLATACMRRLKSPPERDYYDATCLYHELCRDFEKSLQLRMQEVQDFIARGKVYDEFEARLAQLRLMVKIGLGIEEHLSEARDATRKFHCPECYLPLIEQIELNGIPTGPANAE